MRPSGTAPAGEGVLTPWEAVSRVGGGDDRPARRTFVSNAQNVAAAPDGKPGRETLRLKRRRRPPGAGAEKRECRPPRDNSGRHRLARRARWERAPGRDKGQPGIRERLI